MEDAPFTDPEVLGAIHRFKNNKTPGEDKCAMELFKWLRALHIPKLTALYNDILQDDTSFPHTPKTGEHRSDI